MRSTSMGRLAAAPDTGAAVARLAHRVLAITAAVVVAAIGLAPAAGAQQIVDAGKEGDGSGGLAFVLLALLVMLIWAALFFMDRIRRRGEESTTE